MAETSAQERFKRGAADAGRFFRYVAEFIGFTEEQAETIRETRFIIEKHIPSIVAAFYAQLLRFPATRQHFLRRDGSLDRPYLELRMQHQANFWRRAASGRYGEDFARYVDYVGRAHTSQGADPRIYIPERYVIGMVGFVQQRISEALEAELRDIDPELERRAARAWSALLMVVLELLSRSYRPPQEETPMRPREEIDDEAMMRLSVETYERALGMARSVEYRVQRVVLPGEIGEGGRKIVQVEDLSIGVFRHKGQWVALHNSCLHRGGPVCTGKLEGDTLTCPWHGYQYELPGGKLLLDPDVALPRYEVEEREDGVYVRIPILIRDEVDTSLGELEQAAPMPPAELAPLPGAPVAAAVVEAPVVEAAVALPTKERATLPLEENQFAVSSLAPGQIGVVSVDGEAVAVYNVEGQFYATEEECTHAGGPLSQGDLDGYLVVCPWHDSCFDVRSGEVRCEPAEVGVRRYAVSVADGVGTVTSLQ